MTGVPLPAGLKPTPISFQPNEVLAGGVVTGYRFDLLTTGEETIGLLDGVTGGSLEWSAYTAIKGSGSIQVEDVGVDVDWLNARVRPVAITRGIGAEPEVEYPLGVYVCAAPKEQWTSLGRRWSVELLDKCAVLDQDIVTNSLGDPVRYVAPLGGNVIAIVVTLIQGVGEATPAIEPDSVVLGSDLTWDLGVSVLTIVNDLLAAGGYASLWVDGAGQYRVDHYAPPAQRVPIYSTLAPFTVGNRSVLDPNWERDRDIYNIPNRYVAVGVSSETVEAPVAVVVNDDVNNPFSFQSRGRWITRVVTGVEAASAKELESRAWMGLAQASSVTSGITIQHRFLPELKVNSVIRFSNPAADIDLLCYVTNTSVPFSATELCKSEIREAVV